MEKKASMPMDTIKEDKTGKAVWKISFWQLEMLMESWKTTEISTTLRLDRLLHNGTSQTEI